MQWLPANEHNHQGESIAMYLSMNWQYNLVWIAPLPDWLWWTDSPWTSQLLEYILKALCPLAKIPSLYGQWPCHMHPVSFFCVACFLFSFQPVYVWLVHHEIVVIPSEQRVDWVGGDWIILFLTIHSYIFLLSNALSSHCKFELLIYSLYMQLWVTIWKCWCCNNGFMHNDPGCMVIWNCSSSYCKHQLFVIFKSQETNYMNEIRNCAKPCVCVGNLQKFSCPAFWQLLVAIYTHLCITYTGNECVLTFSASSVRTIFGNNRWIRSILYPGLFETFLPACFAVVMTPQIWVKIEQTKTYRYFRDFPWLCASSSAMLSFKVLHPSLRYHHASLQPRFFLRILIVSCGDPDSVAFESWCFYWSTESNHRFSSHCTQQ